MKRIDPRTCTSLNFSALQLSLGHDHLGEIRPCLKSRGRRRRCLFASQRSHPPFRNLYPPYKCLQVCVAAHDILHMGYLVPERLQMFKIVLKICGCQPFMQDLALSEKSAVTAVRTGDHALIR